MSVYGNIDWLRSPSKSRNNNYADDTKYDYSDSCINTEETDYYSHQQQVFDNDDGCYKEKSNKTQHIKISASQHRLPLLDNMNSSKKSMNKTKIKRCLSSPSLSSYTLSSKSSIKPLKIKHFADLKEIYKQFPSLRLIIENSWRKNKLPFGFNNGSYILCHHKWHCVQHSIISGFFQTFAASFVLKTSLLLFQNVLFGKLITSNGINMTQFKKICTNHDTLLFAQFMGLMSFSYKAILCSLRRYFKNDNIKYKTIAGFFAGFWIFLDNPRRQRIYAMNGIIRACGDAIKLSVYYNKLPTIPGFNIACFTLSQLILINASFWRPSCVHPTLYKFLLKLSNFNEEKIQMLRDGILTKKFVPCYPLLHEHKSCLISNIIDFFRSFKKAFTVYVAVHFLPLLLFEPKKVFLDPNKYYKQSLRNTIISCLFVASYNFMVTSNICLIRNIFKMDYSWSGIFCGLFASLTLFIEDTKRRPELTLYCIPRAIEIIMRLFSKKKSPKIYKFLRSKYLRIISFQICMAIWLTVRSIPKGITKSNKINMTILKLTFGAHN